MPLEILSRCTDCGREYAPHDVTDGICPAHECPSNGEYHVTVVFKLHDNDLRRAVKNMLDTDPHPATQHNLSDLIQDVMYDNGNGPMLEGNFEITRVVSIDG